MSTLDVVAEVLRDVAPRALKAREIAAWAGGRLPTVSKTPATVVSRDLAIDVRDRGASSRFLRVARGAFVLKEALPTSLYNDVDPYAAAWARNLIAAGEIAAGVVDARSIRDLKPADVASYRQFHAFGGLGVWSRALRDAGWPDEANVWTGSCPCPPLAATGNFVDEQHFWPAWFRLIAACRPAWLFGEQLSNKNGVAWLDLVRADLEGANYAFRVLDIPACCAGAPHRLQRLYFVAYARERGHEILGASWLHDRGHPGNDLASFGAADHSPSVGEATGVSCGCLGAVGRDDVGTTSDGSVDEHEDDGGACGDGEMVRGAAGVARDGSGDRTRLRGDPSWGGAVGGFWAEDVEWTHCRPEPGYEEGRWRPVEPGTCALVDGVAPSVGRTLSKRLRVVCNALVRPLGAAFVGSVLDALVHSVQVAPAVVQDEAPVADVEGSSPA